MKKALLVTRVSGFVPQHEMNNVKILQEMGCEVHYATDLNNVVYGADNSRLEGSGIITHQIDFCRSPFSRKVKLAQRQLEHLMLQESFDLIHCHMPMSAVVARRAAQRVRKKTGREIPVLYTAHGFHFCRGVRWTNWLYYPVERHYARYTDRLILINDEDYRRGSRFPVRGKAVKINGVGIDLDRIDRELRDSRQDIRQLYGLPPDSIILVTVGELAPEKNHLLAVRMMAELRDMNISYLICGAGRMEETLRKTVQRLKIESKVRFAGYVENVPALLGQCDCFLFPSEREGLPVAVMEAMAVGLPVIAADIRGVHDLVENGKGGMLCRRFSVQEYAACVYQMFAGKAGEDLRGRMGRWNCQRVRAFSKEITGEQMRHIYSEVMK